MDVLKRPIKQIGEYQIHYYQEKPVLVTGSAWSNPQTPFEPLEKFRGALNLYNREFSPIFVPPEIVKIFEKKAILSPFSNPKAKYAVEIKSYSDIDTYLGVGVHPKTYKELSDFTHQKDLNYEAGVVVNDKKYVREEEKKVVEIVLRPLPERFIESFDSFFFDFFENSGSF